MGRRRRGSNQSSSGRQDPEWGGWEDSDSDVDRRVTLASTTNWLAEVLQRISLALGEVTASTQPSGPQRSPRWQPYDADPVAPRLGS